MTSRLDIAQRNLAAHRESADQVAGFRMRDGALLIVADGAGNSSAGRLAAAHLVDAVTSALHRNGFAITTAASWAQLLAAVDRALFDQGHGGETTGVVLWVTQNRIVGASVGDSEAWLLKGDAVHVLTSGQSPKPLLGSGRACPVTFEHYCSGGTVLVASDGLFKYVPDDAVIRAMRGGNAEAAATTLSELPRMPNGQLPDDVGIVVCRYGSLFDLEEA